MKKKYLFGLYCCLLLVGTGCSQLFLYQKKAPQQSEKMQSFTSHGGAYKVFWDTMSRIATGSTNDAGTELQLITSAQNSNVSFLHEKKYLTMEELKQKIQNNIEKTTTGSTLISEEIRTIANQSVLIRAVEVHIENYTFISYGFYFSNKNGTVQIVAYTSKEIFPLLKPTIEKLWEGVLIYPEKGNQDKTFSSQSGLVAVTYDANTWDPTTNIHPTATLQLQHKNGDVFAFMLLQKEKTTLDAQKIIDTMQKTIPDAHIIYEEQINVNNTPFLSLKIGGSVEKTALTYLGQYTSGTEGTIQFVTVCPDMFFEKYKDDIKKLLNGIKVK